MKQKIYKFTPTGEVRPPKYNEYFIRTDNLMPDRSSYDFSDNRTILKLEIIEEEWKPKDGEPFYIIDSLCEVITLYSTFGLNPKLLDVGNCFPTKELAEEKLEKIKQVLRGEGKK